MSHRLLSVAGLALAAVLVVAGAMPARAGAQGSAVYYGVWEMGGELAISGDVGAMFQVRNEQQDGSYLTVAKGTISEDGTARVVVPHAGPTANGTPQYVVTVRPPSGMTYTLLATGPLEEEWWLD